MPILPPKSILKLSEPEIEKRKLDLNKYMKVGKYIFFIIKFILIII
jgi:hypothetical protein